MELAGKRVTVMGLGRFGGGVGVARYLVKQGADVLVTDLLKPEELEASVAQLEGLPIEYRLGEHNVSDFTTCDLVVANPAVKPGNRFLRAAVAAGIPITSEIRLLVKALPNRLRTIGVTGTAGKSTTTAMIGEILERCTTHRVWVGGNIGGSLLDHMDEIEADDWVVLELSSFMLHGLGEDRWSPHIAVITNISPNHLDWHGTYESYVSDKRVILAFQEEGDRYVLGPGVEKPTDSKAEHWPYVPETAMAKAVGLKLPGEHNYQNAVTAATGAYCAGVNIGFGLMKGLSEFSGLPHRLQFVMEHNGVRYFNDSKCTTPEAAELAIKSFDKGTVHIILGGYDKGSDLKPLAELAARQCAGIYTIGKTGDVIATAAEAASVGDMVLRCGELDVAVPEVVNRAKAGEVVLLSPACASWDQFDNYEQRGERFIELVKSLAG